MKTPTRKRILGVALLALVLGGGAWFVLRPKPSIYQAPLNQLVASRGASSDALATFRTAGPQAVPFLINKLTNSTPARRRYVVRKSSINSSWLYRILPAWNFDGWSEREYAALALGEIGPVASNAVPALIDAIARTEIHETDLSKGASNGRTSSSAARVEAIRALGKINPQSPEVIAALVEAVRQQNMFMRRVTAGGVTRSDPVSVREAAAEVLAGLGPQSVQVIPRLIENLEFQDKTMFRGLSAVYPIGAIAPGYAQTVPPLMKALKDPSSQIRASAAYDLGTLRPKDLAAAKQALPDLIELLQDSVAEVKLRAAEAVLKIDLEHGPVAVPALIELTEDPDYTVRLRAVDGLRRVGSTARSAIPNLRKRSNDDAQVVRIWSAKVLKELEEKRPAE
jgi:HEAT repeat protein